MAHSADLPARPTREIILTGDRPTGPLHLGHYAGSLRSRVALQREHDLTILVADLQALTDHSGRAADVRRKVTEIVLDYLAVGIEIVLQLETRGREHVAAIIAALQEAGVGVEEDH